MLIGKRIPITFILEKIWLELVIVGVFLAGLWILKESVVDVTKITIPIAVPSVLGTAISLILAFRTNQAYARWWEARKIWGAIVNDSRTWARQVLTLLPADPSLMAMQHRVIHRQILWCYALGKALRGEPPLEGSEGLLRNLDKEEVTLYKKAQNIPNAMLLKQGEEIMALKTAGIINSYEHMQLDDTLSRLCDSMGKNERIKNTVFPKIYSTIVHAFLYLFILLLPFSLVMKFGLLEVATVMGITAVFFLIEKSAIYNQDPFEGRPTDTPVSAIARTIDINLRQMLKEKELPVKATPEKFYLS